MVGINIGHKIPVELGKIQMKNLTVRGCIGSPGVWPAAIRFLERTGIDLSPIQTHSFPLDDAVDSAGAGQEADGSGQSDVGDRLTRAPAMARPKIRDRCAAGSQCRQSSLMNEVVDRSSAFRSGGGGFFRSCSRRGL